MERKVLDLVAQTIDWLEKPQRGGRGRPRTPTVDVLRTLESFIRGGPQWDDLTAAPGRACGSTLRRRLAQWSVQAVLARAHRVLVRMARSGPDAAARAWDVVVDSCSVRAKRGGDLTGPNPTDRGKSGTKYHLVVSTDGLPVAALPSAANVPDTALFAALLQRALVACVAIAKLYADAGYDSRANRGLCLRDGIQPLIRKIGSPHGSGRGRVRSVIERVNERLLRYKRLDRRQDRSADIIGSFLTSVCIFLLAEDIAEF